MKHLLKAGCRRTLGTAVVSLGALLLSAVPLQAQSRDEEQSRWQKLTNRTNSPIRNKGGNAEKEAQAHGGSPYNPKFGAPSFQMPSSAGQDATGPNLKQFHPTQEKGPRASASKFLQREQDPEKLAARAAKDAEGRKVTLSSSGSTSSSAPRRTYDEIYQSKSPHALPTFQMPSGPAAGLAAPGAQTWGSRTLEQYSPESGPKGLEKARIQRAERQADKERAKQKGERSEFWDVFDRNKRLENR